MKNLRLFQALLCLVFWPMVQPTDVLAQEIMRQMNVHDSTIYPLNADSTVLVSQHRVYLDVKGQISALHYFPPMGHEEYIRDFNAVSPNRWYVVTGTSTIAGDATLYRSSDRGKTWAVDTSFYPATRLAQTQGQISNYRCINQLQQVSKDTLLLFVSYYQSGIFYSIDGGENWDLWFANLPQHYYLLWPCKDRYYLMNAAGDGFSGSLFWFEKKYLLSSNSKGEWINSLNKLHPSCFDGNNERCTYIAGSYNLYEQYIFAKKYTEIICGTATSVAQPEPEQDVTIYPNPTGDGKLFVTGETVASSPITANVYDPAGRSVAHFSPLRTVNERVAIELPAQPGIYTVQIITPYQTYWEKVVRE